ncbi:MAG: c-type cytochrome [Spongiibacteraceae bacterium]
MVTTYPIIRHVKYAVMPAVLGLFFFVSAAQSDDAAIAEGQRLYQQNCVFCHQADAIGKPGLAPSLTNPELLSIVSDKFLMGTVRDGRPGTSMPPYAHLGHSQVKAIISYLRSYEKLPRRAAKVDAQAAAKGDVGRGSELFELICSTCHGVKGDGYLAGGSGTAIGKSGFLSKASDGFIRETIKYGRSNTRMLPFSGAEGLANLDDQDVDDIIVYMRSMK